MGLSEPRKRAKISHDPNNTTWSRSTTGYGHKILSSQGWTPGNYLGARDAPHATSYTAANASHIRVFLRDNNLGLGASRAGPVEQQRTGHDAFQGLLGRLNGKSDTDIETEQMNQKDADSAYYLQTRWNLIQFVQGGLLVQDKITLSASTKDQGSSDSNRDDHELKKRKKKKKSKVTGSDPSGKPSADQVTTTQADGLAQSTKVERRRRADRIDKPENEGVDVDTKERDVLTKTSKKAKEKKRSRKDDSNNHLRHDDSAGSPEDTDLSNATTSPSRTRDSTAALEARPTNKTLDSRHAIRNRHIAQKRLALMDTKALDEIFAIRSTIS